MDEEIKALVQLHDAESMLQEHGVEILDSSCYLTYKSIYYHISIELCNRCTFYKYYGQYDDDVWSLHIRHDCKVDVMYGTLEELIVKWKNRQKV